jgi:cob(I)alamin adenosyltransferase
MRADFVFPPFTKEQAMGNRLTQIATRTGDDGSTGLGDNTRVSKNSLRPHAMGDVDELNSHIGLLLCEPLPQDVRELLGDVQHQLFNLGGELSMPGYELLKDDGLLQLDNALAQYNAQLPRLVEFILPAGTRAAAQAHVCRTVARRAERQVVALQEVEAMRPPAPVPQPPVGPAVRAGACAQPDGWRRRCVLEERTPGASGRRRMKACGALPPSARSPATTALPRMPEPRSQATMAFDR